jgi:hypothetical protein
LRRVRMVQHAWLWLGCLTLVAGVLFGLIGGGVSAGAIAILAPRGGPPAVFGWVPIIVGVATGAAASLIPFTAWAILTVLLDTYEIRRIERAHW